MTADRIAIRPATTADVESVAKIYAHYVENTTVTLEEEPPSSEDWQRRLAALAEARLPFLVADACGEIVGYAYAAPWRPKPANRYTVENSIYLAPEYSGRGLGTTLLNALLAACREAGIRQVISVISAVGTDTGGASVALHRRCGFTDAGRLTGTGYKHGCWVDVLLMQCDLLR
ncbi:N-acetyltransferase family protein [Streptomyces sp. NPDC006372]|uniref:GNAT family N-acetyltransferase n=1 Tax=Streptomyces sp. NPDC006372 TaxID=3155599 RepID=UPI0033B4A974